MCKQEIPDLEEYLECAELFTNLYARKNTNTRKRESKINSNAKGLREERKSVVRAGASSVARFFRMRGEIPSGPLAFWGLRFSNSFWTPVWIILMGAIVVDEGGGRGDSPVKDSNSVSENVVDGLNAE